MHSMFSIHRIVLGPHKNTLRKNINAERANSVVAILVWDAVFSTVFMEPLATRTGKPILTRLLFDVFFVRSETYTTYVCVDVL